MKRILLLCIVATCAGAIDETHREKGEEMARHAIEYLRTRQHITGGWSVRPEGPNIPAVSALVLVGMLMDPDIDLDDPTVERGVKWVLQHRQPDGGIYDRILPTYNTSICLSLLGRLDETDSTAAAQDFLRGLQYHEEALEHESVERVSRDHPFYGGIGYGSHGRPDGSNLAMMMQGFADSGVPSDDPAVQRALVFLERLQMRDETNDMAYAEGSAQGGFIYATGPESDEAGTGESKAGTIEETGPDGTTRTRLRAYGSMTYAGFKTYVYASLDRDDPRVQDARRWIAEHYTLDENPGTGMQGFYYYVIMFARALDAWGEPTITTTSGEHDWANDLVDRLAELQNDDGSFRSVHARWMEDNPDLITAYALIALQNALGRE